MFFVVSFEENTIPVYKFYNTHSRLVPVLYWTISSNIVPSYCSLALQCIIFTRVASDLDHCLAWGGEELPPPTEVLGEALIYLWPVILPPVITECSRHKVLTSGATWDKYFHPPRLQFKHIITYIVVLLMKKANITLFDSEHAGCLALSNIAYIRKLM